MSKLDISTRTNRAEIMDDFDLQGDELEVTLQDLDKINRWLGGNKVTIQGVKKLLRSQPKDQPVHIADIGCGNGTMLKEIATWGRSAGYTFKLTGVDANPHAIAIAERTSEYYPEIEYRTMNIFSEEFKQEKFDITTCTLTLHHFKDAQIEEILQDFYSKSRIGIVINDLHRSRKAYHLFRAFCKVFISNKIARDDGLTSILRGFKKKDIKKFAAGIRAKEQEINWKWAFRYQWIIEK